MNSDDKTAIKNAEAMRKTTSFLNSPMAMPKACQAQLDVYKEALAEEDNEEFRA